MATLSTAFAYEGWIIVTVINAELKDAKKTLPRALVMGTVAVAVIYMLYYLGISDTLSNDQVIAAGNDAPVKVLSIIFGAGSLFIIWEAIQKDMFLHFVVVTLVIMCFGFWLMKGKPPSAKSGE